MATRDGGTKGEKGLTPEPGLMLNGGGKKEQGQHSWSYKAPAEPSGVGQCGRGVIAL